MGLAPTQGAKVERVNVGEELLAVVILAADDVHDAVLVHRRVEPALRRGKPAVSALVHLTFLGSERSAKCVAVDAYADDPPV